MRDAIRNGETVRYFYVTNEIFTDSDTQKIQTLNLVRALDAIQLDELISAKVDFVPANQRGQKLQIRTAAGPGGILEYGDSLLLPVSLITLHDFVERGKDFLFASNVRNYLKRSKINEGVRNTI